MTTVIPFALLTCFSGISLCSGNVPASHLKPFGYGVATQIEEIEGFPPVKKFFEEFVLPNKPVVMRGANKVWPGFTNWQTDEYFMSVAPEEPFIVSMDVKRGTPDTPADFVNFKDFLQLYNTSKRRMVEHTPPFIVQDVFLPGSLGCDSISQGEKIWFGSNYTTSVVHKDAADNINCLVYGVKNYTVLSPKYDPKVLLDRPDGLYSTMDVDSVDAYKYPGLDDVEYLISELQAGDCVFIPYKWIHQVRSYGRNIAVNTWWNHWKNSELNLENCPEVPEEKPINTAKFHGWGDFESRDEGVWEHTRDLVAMSNVIKPLSYPGFVALYTSFDPNALSSPMDLLRMVDKDIKDALRAAFMIIDTNKDKRITAQEMDALSVEEGKRIVKHIKFVLKVSRERSEDYENKDKDKVAQSIPGLVDDAVTGEHYEDLPSLQERNHASPPITHDEI
ncbi:uncharacterized protein [Watersipora subatra]|uniref:uncharacterized protein isoform X2 n=1 Tax=Watersipora subatra TaxID=2589382 RepID=UPI00355BDD80